MKEFTLNAHVKVEGGSEHHTGPRAPLFNAAVVQRWEVVLDKGKGAWQPGCNSQDI